MSIDLPDSALCRASEEHARTLSPPFLFNHAMRSFVFANAAGESMGWRYDRELLFAATVLHDLGLTGAVPAQERFEVEGADAAEHFLAGHGLARDGLALVWDAIALHTTQTIPQRKAPEIALCQLGTAIDVGYAPLHLLPEGLAAETLARFPRLDFKRAFVALLASLHDRNPAAAAASAPVADVGERHVHGFRRIHFCDVIAQAGFAE